MTWIRVEDSLPDHPKLLRLARSLRVSETEAMGWLLRLWLWTSRVAPDGELGAYEPGDVELALRWMGEPGALIGALISLRLIDLEANRMSVHDWMERAERSKAAQRKRAERARKKTSHATVTRQSRDTGVTVAEDGRTDGRTDETLTSPNGDVSATADPQTSLAVTIEPRSDPAERYRCAWNAVVAGKPVPAARKSHTRDGHARARWAEHPDEKEWRLLLAYVASEPFYAGSNDRGWVIDSSWLVKSAETFDRVLAAARAWDQRGRSAPRAPEPARPETIAQRLMREADELADAPLRLVGGEDE